MKIVILVLVGAVILSGCAHRAIGFRQTTGVHPYWVDVRADGTMDYGKGNGDKKETGKWWKIDSEVIVFVNQDNKARYFKFSANRELLEQPFRQDTDYDKLTGRSYSSSLE